MDNAVALVRAYLHLNSYFTVTEYQVVGLARHGSGYRSVTDLDVQAFRFPGADLSSQDHERWAPDAMRTALRAPTPSGSGRGLLGRPRLLGFRGSPRQSGGW